MFLEEILDKLKNNQQKIAYIVDNKQYTYSQLYTYICNIYNYLLEHNTAKTPVLVYGHKEIYMKASFLACSFAGMAYVPVDKNMPRERVKSIKKQLKPKIIIDENITDIMEQKQNGEISEVYMKPDDIYYIIFTSGSTGIPKGVMVSYKNVDSCIKWLQSISNVTKSVILNHANYSFDLSVADLYLSMVTASTHFIINNSLDFSKMFNDLKRSNAELAVFTPSFADLLLLDKSFNQELMPNLKKIIFCGEKLLKSTLAKLFERFPNLEVINCYGPTECTFAVTNISLNKNNYKGFQEIPIGYSKQNVDIYIVDEDLHETEEGEILITGESVAKGYLLEKEK